VTLPANVWACVSLRFFDLEGREETEHSLPYFKLGPELDNADLRGGASYDRRNSWYAPSLGECLAQSGAKNPDHGLPEHAEGGEYRVRRGGSETNRAIQPRRGEREPAEHPFTVYLPHRLKLFPGRLNHLRNPQRVVESMLRAPKAQSCK